MNSTKLQPCYSSNSEYRYPIDKSQRSNEPLQTRDKATILATHALSANSQTFSPTSNNFKLSIEAKEWTPSKPLEISNQGLNPLPTLPNLVKNLQESSTRYTFIPNEELAYASEITKIGREFINADPSKITSEKIINFLESLMKFPREQIPLLFLEKAATETRTNIYKFNIYDLFEVIELFHKLNHKPEYLVNALKSHACKLIPNANPRKLILAFSYLSLICNIFEESKIINKIKEQIDKTIINFRINEIIQIIYMLSKSKKDNLEIIDKAFKSIINLAANDLRIRSTTSVGDGNPLFFEIEPKNSICVLELYREIFSKSFNPELLEFTPSIVESIDWQTLDDLTKKTRLINAIINVVISQKNEYTSDQKSKLKTLFSEFNVQYAPLDEALKQDNC